MKFLGVISLNFKMDGYAYGFDIRHLIKGFLFSYGYENDLFPGKIVKTKLFDNEHSIISISENPDTYICDIDYINLNHIIVASKYNLFILDGEIEKILHEKSLSAPISQTFISENKSLIAVMDSQHAKVRILDTKTLAIKSILKLNYCDVNRSIILFNNRIMIIRHERHLEIYKHS
jgi:hypothetical protein